MMSLSAETQIRRMIDERGLSPLQWLVVSLCFLLNTVDGFDVVAMSVAMPYLAAEWAISPEQKGYLLSAALIGMTVGAMFLAPLADRIGRRRLLMLAAAMIGSSMLIIGLVPQTLPLMIAMRVISGLGIGMVLANGATIGAEFSPERYRTIVVTSIIMGYPLGATIIGPVASQLIPAYGWQAVFVVGGVFALGMLLLIWLKLPESVFYLAGRAQACGSQLAQINRILQQMRCPPLTDWMPVNEKQLPARDVRGLFGGGLALATLGLWLSYFMGFATLYFLMSWIPTLFEGAGFARSEGIAALTLFNLGALLGIVLIGWLSATCRLPYLIGGFFLASALAQGLVFFRRPENMVELNGLIFLIGLLLQGGFTALYALAARLYPTPVRATGLGWAAGLGRTGAILAPIGVGYLVASGWSMYALFLLFAAPLLIAAAIIHRYRI